MGNNSSNSSLDKIGNHIENELTLIKTFNYELIVIILSNKTSKGELILEYKSGQNTCSLPDFFDKDNGTNNLNGINTSDLKKCFSLFFTFEKLIINAKLPLRLRHPSILGLRDPCTSSRGSFRLVAEAARPLALCLDKLSFEEVVYGVHSLLSGIDFIHSVTKLSHNNLTLNSLFVTGDGGWRLAGFELSLPLDKMSRDCQVILELIGRNNLQDEKALAFSKDRSDAYDIFCFGRLVLSIIEDLGLKDSAMLNLAQYLEEACHHSDPNKRPTVSQIAQHDLFNNPYVEVNVFLENFTIKMEEEKDVFFSNLPQLLLQIPESLLARRLVFKLLGRVILVDSRSHTALRLLLNPYQGEVRPLDGQSILSETLFKNYVVPLLEKIFLIQERYVRLALLKHFEVFAKYIDRNVLRTSILPKIRLGLYDSHSPLVAATLHALGDLVSILGPEQVTGLPIIPSDSVKGTAGSLFPASGPKIDHVIAMPTRGASLSRRSSGSFPSTVAPGIKPPSGKPAALNIDVISKNNQLKISQPVKISAKSTYHIASFTPSNHLSEPPTSVPCTPDDIKPSSPLGEETMDASFNEWGSTSNWDYAVTDDDDGLGLTSHPQPPSNPLNTASIQLPLRTTSSLSNQSEPSTASGSTLSSNQKRGSKPPRHHQQLESKIIIDVKEMEVVTIRSDTDEAIDNLFADMAPKISAPKVDSSKSTKAETTPSFPTQHEQDNVNHISSSMRMLANTDEDAGAAWTEDWGEEVLSELETSQPI